MNANRQFRVGVEGTIIENGKILLVRHTYGDKKGRWALPGGYANPDECVDEAIQREIREEIGLETEVIDIIGLISRHNEEEGVVVLVFRLRPISGDPNPDGTELDRVGWFSYEEAAAMTPQELLPAIRNPVLAALKAPPGLREDKNFLKYSASFHAFLVQSD